MKLLEENKRKSLQPQGGQKCLDRQYFQVPVIKGPKKMINWTSELDNLAFQRHF